jgi:DNA uptake protein ComE-like DNA-binding protein
MLASTNDHRLLVLLVLAALIFVTGWITPAPDAQVSSYYWEKGRLIRSKDSRAGQGMQIVAGMSSCAGTPPELAAFFNLPLPVNRADQAALMRLPGIGPKLAESIITYRKGQGGITKPDDFIKVKGIGPKRSARLLPLLCCDNAQ